MSQGPVHLDAGQPSLQIPTESGEPITVRIRAARGAAARRHSSARRLENILGVPRPWTGDPGQEPPGVPPLSRAQRSRHTRGLPPIQELAIQVRGLRVTTPGGRTVVGDVSFDVAPGEVLAIAGPDQSAVAAVVQALVGSRPFTGRISYGAEHLTGETAPRVRSVLGIIPRRELPAGPMPLGRALEHAARLRQAGSSAPARREAVAEVSQALGLAGELHLPLDRLSAASRKRAAVAAEVVSRASVIVLEDPTEGLDPAEGAELLRMLQALALTGRRTIVITTNATAALSAADSVVLLDTTSSGSARLGYHGPPEAAPAHFGAGRDWDFAHVYAQLADPAADWAGSFRPRLSAFDPDIPGGPALHRRSWPGLVGSAWRLAAQRVEELRWAPGTVAALAGPAVALVVIALAVLGWGNFDPTPPTAAATSPRLLLGFATLVAVLPGLLVAGAEVVRERRRLDRDLAVGLSPAAYVLGRWGALAVASVPPALLALVLFVGQGGGPGVLAAAVVLVLGAAAAVALGLAVSALSRRQAPGLWGVGAVLVAHVLLCGAFVAVEDSPLRFVAALSPGYWVFRGLATSADLARLDDATPWAVAGGVGGPVIALVMLTAAGLLAAALLLCFGPRSPVVGDVDDQA
ncbi:MAG: ABC transporter permease [Tetrasphaera sp.]